MGFNVAAAHLDHGIRPSAERDAAKVAQLCHGLGITCVFGAEDVPGYAHRYKMGLEEAGRELRYRFLREAGRMCDCSRIATAHHQQDQAETLIMRLSRGTSVSGLKGISVCHLPFIRPLLMAQRSQVESYLEQHGLAYVEDESNTDCRFTRNYVRHNLMPMLQEVHPEAQKHVAQLAQQVCMEEGFWAEEVNKALLKARFAPEEARIPYADLAPLHPALRIRVNRAILERIRGSLRGLERKHMQVLESMFNHPGPQVQFDLPGAWVARRYSDVVFRAEAPQEGSAAFHLCIDGPGGINSPMVPVWR